MGRRELAESKAHRLPTSRKSSCTRSTATTTGKAASGTNADHLITSDLAYSSIQPLQISPLSPRPTRQNLEGAAAGARSVADGIIFRARAATGRAKVAILQAVAIQIRRALSVCSARWVLLGNRLDPSALLGNRSGSVGNTCASR